MKTKLTVLMSIIAVVLLCLFGCSPPSEVSVDESYNGKQVEIAVAGTLTVTLESNATTGFQWGLASISNQAVLVKRSNTYEAQEDTSMVGAPGKEVWTFTALKKGTSTISMEYSQPWEGGEKAATTFSLAVFVK